MATHLSAKQWFRKVDGSIPSCASSMKRKKLRHKKIEQIHQSLVNLFAKPQLISTSFNSFSPYPNSFIALMEKVDDLVDIDAIMDVEQEIFDAFENSLKTPNIIMETRKVLTFYHHDIQ